MVISVKFEINVKICIEATRHLSLVQVYISQRPQRFFNSELPVTLTNLNIDGTTFKIAIHGVINVW